MRLAQRFGLLLFAEVILSGAGSPLTIRQGRPIVDGVYVNGCGPYRFLIDTGAESNQLDVRLAKAVGLRPLFQAEMVSLGGVRRVAGASGVALQLGEAETPAEVLFTDLAAVRAWAPEVQGVLGQAFLGQFDYRLDYRAGAIAFGVAERAGIRAELDRGKGWPVVFTSLGKLIVDSGTNRLILFGKPAGAAVLVRAAGGSVAGGKRPSKRLFIEGEEVKAGEIMVVARPEYMAEDGLLPAVLFGAIHFRNSQGYVVLE